MGTPLFPFANKNFSKQVARHRATTSVTTTEFAFISTKRPCTGHIDANKIVNITTEIAADLFNSILFVEFIYFLFVSIQEYIFHSIFANFSESNIRPSSLFFDVTLSMSFSRLNDFTTIAPLVSFVLLQKEQNSFR